MRHGLAFTDGRPRAVGATSQIHPRSSMSLANVGYSSRLAWANPLLDRLEHQAAIVIFGEEPVEMGMAGLQDVLLQRLSDDPATAARFEAAFPDHDRPVTTLHVLQAIASFERSLVSFGSPYDRFVAGDGEALSDAQQRGHELFVSERLECFHCHGGPTFSDTLRHDGQLVSEFGFHVTALYAPEVLADAAHPGIAEITRREEDVGRFKAPTLRNIAVTAPYMHDGSLPTLEAVLHHYEHGGRAGEGHPARSEFVSGFILTDQERRDLLSFLDALTDPTFLTDPRYADPLGQ
ncbi:MAG: di-heme enzyme [Myxococcales bacterium]|nr:di-heme enzyme [Myxococcales bacterium]